MCAILRRATFIPSYLSRRAPINRIWILLFLIFFFGLAVSAKLIDLQLIKKNYYTAKAQVGHLGYSEVNARRGEIFIRDYHSQETFRLATNSAVALLYADPTLVKDPQYIADKLAQLIFDGETAREKDKDRIRELKRRLPPNATKGELDALAPKSEDILRQEFKAELLTKLSQKTRQSLILYKEPPPEMLEFFASHKIAGIEASAEAVTAYPPQIGDAEYAAKVLSPIIDIPYERLRKLLVGRNAYAILRNKLTPDLEQKIRALMADDKKAGRDSFVGIGLEQKNHRFYPEGPLAAQVIGFTSEKGGVYGIEQSYDNTLRGKKGILKTKLDATGQQVIVGDDLIIQPPVDGDSIVLTLDRSIQMTVEKLLAKTVDDVKADSGLVMILEPSTGRIISLAQYPAFDPNDFGKALETEDVSLTNDEIKNIVTLGSPGNETHYLYLDADSNYRIQVFQEILENGKIIISKFKNVLGPGVYRNRAVADLFEPGSIFKAIAMAIALDDGDVTPNTTFNDSGPLKLNEFLPNGEPIVIHNATESYGGITTMREVLEKSLNTGMSFVARKMGRELFYRYMRKFGFGEKTEVEFENEEEGKIEEPSRWAESELVTHAFGQGISMTPTQMVTAVAALANKGILMKPHIIYEILNPDGKRSEIEPEEVRRVISEKTAATITAMMTSVVENGGASRVKMPDHYIAGKTGTAQTYKHGKPLTGPGTTIASFIGFAPVNSPRFVVLVKIDRPRTTIWADATAAPLFHEIAQFLFKYYNLPPDK